MAGDKGARTPQDSPRTAMDEAFEVRCLPEKFGVSRVQLQKAVDAVGDGAAAVERHLKGDL